LLELAATQFIQQLGHDLHLLIIGIVLIIIGEVVGPLLIASRAWRILTVIGVIVVIVWLVLLLLGLAA
jgi:low affinity Fe/Cu permease